MRPLPLEFKGCWEQLAYVKPHSGLANIGALNFTILPCLLQYRISIILISSHLKPIRMSKQPGPVRRLRWLLAST